MMTRVLNRYALCSGVAVAMLAGCGGSQPPIGAPGAMPHSVIVHRMVPASAYKVLYHFSIISGDGVHPRARLINVNGTLYGTTFTDGAYKEGAGAVQVRRPPRRRRIPAG
jgi:hypothetical protein